MKLKNIFEFLRDNRDNNNEFKSFKTIFDATDIDIATDKHSGVCAATVPIVLHPLARWKILNLTAWTCSADSERAQASCAE